MVGKKLKVSGYDNVDPDHSYLIISNYPSFYAGFSLIGIFPQASIVVHAFVKKVPLLGQVLSRVGTIFVQPGPAGQGKRAVDFHLNKHDISSSRIILPEGARTPDGKIHRFRRCNCSRRNWVANFFLPICVSCNGWPGEFREYRERQVTLVDQHLCTSQVLWLYDSNPPSYSVQFRN